MRPGCTCKCDCKPDTISFWWMRDNHTFVHLKGKNLAEIVEHAKFCNIKEAYGMLCPATLLRKDQDFGRVGNAVHGNDEFGKNLPAWIREIESDPMAAELLAQGKIDNQ